MHSFILKFYISNVMTVSLDKLHSFIKIFQKCFIFNQIMIFYLQNAYVMIDRELFSEKLE